MTTQLGQPRPGGQSYRRIPARGSGRWIMLALAAVIIVIGGVTLYSLTRRPAAMTAPEAVSEPASTAAPLTTADMTGFLDEAMTRQMEAQHIPDAAAAVVRNGELLAARGYGSVEIEQQEPVNAEQTIFLTGSTGKIFVWTSVMQLAEQGKLNLDANVNEYLNFQIPATYPQPITLRHLMSHSAGFEDQLYIYVLDPTEIEAPGQFLAGAIPARVRAPGELSAYSNYGAALAGYIVERVSGQPFEEYVEEHIFAPLAMHSSSFRQPLPPELAANLIPSYGYHEGAFHVLAPKYVRIPATGASVTTVEDMATFMIAHLEGGQAGTGHILQEDTVAQMHSRHFAHDPRASGFAYGFAESTLNGQRLLRHEGEVTGRGCSALMLIPAERLGFYVTYNGMCTMNSGTQIWSKLLDRYFPVPPPDPATEVTAAADLQPLAGAYRSSRHSYSTIGKSIILGGGAFADIEVTVTGSGTLRTVGLGPEALSWIEVEPSVFRVAGDDDTIYGRLLFQPASTDQAARLLVENVPYRAWERIAWYQTVGSGLAVAGVCAIVFLSALLLPLAGLLWRRSPDAVQPTPALRRARRLATLSAALYLLFPLLFVLVGFGAMEYGVTPALIIVLALPIVASLFMVASLIFAVRGRNDPAWGGAFRRMHYAAVVVAAVAFALWLNSWNLFGLRV